jgi:hypothetical protein
LSQFAPQNAKKTFLFFTFSTLKNHLSRLEHLRDKTKEQTEYKMQIKITQKNNS